VNESLNTFDTELIRQKNVIQGAPVRGDKPYHRFIQQLAPVASDQVLAAMRRSLRSLPINDNMPLLARIPSNLVQSCRMNLVAPHRNWLFRPRTRVIEYVGDDYLMQPGVPEAIRVIYRALTPAVAQ